ncbi:hypothetical protein [Enterovibrio sp. FF113]|uniref:hypothetical protein n=1 Tax=Enterovibrio sp. FF113 TaxID=3230010 RepID=UPI00352BF97C
MKYIVPFVLLVTSLNAWASLSGSYSTPPDSLSNIVFSVTELDDKIILERRGELYAAAYMDKVERSEFASYLAWGADDLQDSECLVMPLTPQVKIEEIVASKGGDVVAVTATGKSTLRFIDEQNTKSFIRLPKFKIRQVLCISESSIPRLKSNAFFYNHAFGVVPVIKR